MQRRELFPILIAANLSAQHEHHRAAIVSTDAYKLKYFNGDQNAILDKLSDVIFPDASRARVSQYFDLIATHVEPVRKAFLEGLEDFNTLAQSKFEAKLQDLSVEQLTELLEIASAHEGNPTNGAESFFELIKFHTVEGYRLSYIGQTEWIGYKPHPPGLYPDLTLD
ncbi:MAG: gluconate 2-dehydrogenase subunit 3 family protein [Chloroflexia bacterium]